MAQIEGQEGANRKLLILGIAGGAAAAIYFAMKKQQQVATAYVITGVPEAPPSLLDAILNKIPAAITPFLEKADALDKAIKAKGDAHYKKWKEAVKSGSAFYSVGALCFRTATGVAAPQNDCMTSGAFLEGCNCG